MMIVKKVFISIIGISILVTSVALMAAAVAPYIDPASFDLTAFFGLMYPLLLLLHLIMFICYFLIKRSKQSLLFLIPALLTIQLFMNSFGVNYLETKERTGTTVKLMTYNVHMFRDANSFSPEAQLPMLQLMQDERPDIICMQDFQLGSSETDSIKAVLRAGYFYNGPRDPAIFPTGSIATLSKFPIVNAGFIVLSETSPGSQAVFTDIDKNGKIMRVYNVHFESLGFRAEEYEEWRNGGLIGKFKFLYKVKDKFSVAFALRSEQVKTVKKHAASCPYPYIIAGDFNDTPSSFAVNYTMKGMKNAFREKGRGYTVTFNGGLPDFQIDYVMVNPFFRVLDYKVIRKKLSDHYPVAVTLGFE